MTPELASVTEKGVSVTKLIQRMREELVRRNYAETTIRSYLQTMEEFRRLCRKRLDHLGADEIRRYQVHLLEEKKLAVGTVAYRVRARSGFFYVRDTQTPGDEGGSPLSESAETPAPDDPDAGRSFSS